LGSNDGGFFIHKGTKKQYYIKWLNETPVIKNKDKNKDKDPNGFKYRNFNRCCNEVLASKIYELYGVSVPKTELITFVRDGVKYYGITSEKQEGIKMLRDAYSSKDKQIFEEIRQKAQEDFLIDVLLSNYDVVGLGMNNMFYYSETKKPFRLDPGGALRYRAQGGAKKSRIEGKKIRQFDDKAGEFEDMESGTNTNTKFNQGPLHDAGLVFKGVHNSPTLLISLRKLMSVTDDQLAECVEKHGFDVGKELANKGKEKNQVVIAQLKSRKKTLIEKAENKILDRLMNGLKNPEERRKYLEQAGVSEKSILEILSIMENKHRKEDVISVIRTDLTTPETSQTTFFKTENIPGSVLNNSPNVSPKS
jgi:hypothetical protein